MGMCLFFKNSFRYQFYVNVGSKMSEVKLHSVIHFLNVLVFLIPPGKSRALILVNGTMQIRPVLGGIFIYRVSINVYIL